MLDLLSLGPKVSLPMIHLKNSLPWHLDIRVDLITGDEMIRVDLIISNADVAINTYHAGQYTIQRDNFSQNPRTARDSGKVKI